MKHAIEPLRVAVIGARRGETFITSSRGLDGIRLAAVCDSDPLRLEAWKGQIKVCQNIEDILSDSEIDAVCIATPVPMHAEQAIAALRAGKHVLSEVTAAYTLEECADLVAAVEGSGLTYMMAENYCFMDEVLQVQNMVEQGVFGDLVYASGGYIHDCRELFLTPDGDLTWRGDLRRQALANSYPTHSLGPVARWLGINRHDFLKTTATWQSRGGSVPKYASLNHPQRPEYAAPEFWLHPDTVSTMIRTEKDVLIDIRVDWASARPHHMTRYELQGTKAAFSWPDSTEHSGALIWIEGRSPQNKKGTAEKWEPLTKYREEFQHPLWREHREEAMKAGHGGGDYFVLREFAAAIREQRRPLIDVYDAVTWSSITPLSALSVQQGNMPVSVPNFLKEKK